MRRLETTQHTVRCPLEDCTAALTVRTDPEGYPSCRHLEVRACSLLPPTPFVPAARRGYFPDVAPALSYLCEADPTPRHRLDVPCATPCLAVLNAAEPGAAEPPRCTSGVSDAQELARQIESPAMARALWLHGV